MDTDKFSFSVRFGVRQSGHFSFSKSGLYLKRSVTIKKDILDYIFTKEHRYLDYLVIISDIQWYLDYILRWVTYLTRPACVLSGSKWYSQEAINHGPSKHSVTRGISINILLSGVRYYLSYIGNFYFKN